MFQCWCYILFRFLYLVSFFLFLEVSPWEDGTVLSTSFLWFPRLTILCLYPSVLICRRLLFRWCIRLRFSSINPVKLQEKFKIIPNPSVAISSIKLCVCLFIGQIDIGKTYSIHSHKHKVTLAFLSTTNGWVSWSTELANWMHGRFVA